MISVVKMCLPQRLLCIVILCCFSIGAIASSLPETTPVSNIKKLFEQSDVVVLGEWHDMSNHKEFLEMTLRDLIASKTIDTFAFEFVDGADNSLLQEYLHDPRATVGSPKELDYLLKFSNRNRKSGFFGRSGGWSVVLDESYARIFRLMKSIYQQDPKAIKFCGVDFNDTFITSLNGFGSGFEANRLLPNEYLKLGEKTYGNQMWTSRDDWRSIQPGTARELRMTLNTENCLRGGKKALVYLGAYHAHKLQGTVRQLLASRLSDRKVISGAISTMSQEQINTSSETGVYNPKFHREHLFTDWQTIEGSQLLSDSFNDLALKYDDNGINHVIPISDQYDFLVFGPVSTEINHENLPKERPILGNSKYNDMASTIDSQQISEVSASVSFEDFPKSVVGSARIVYSKSVNGRVAFRFNGKIKSVAVNGKKVQAKQIWRYQPAGRFSSVIYSVPVPTRNKSNIVVDLGYALLAETYTEVELPYGRDFIFSDRIDNRVSVGATNLFPDLNLPAHQPNLTLSVHLPRGRSVYNYRVNCNCTIKKTSQKIQLKFGVIPTQQLFFKIEPEAFAQYKISQPGTPKINAYLNSYFMPTSGPKSIEQAFGGIALGDIEQRTLNLTTTAIREMTDLFGAYPNGPSFDAYIHGDVAGASMEYRGAVASGLGILVHEIVHQWWAIAVKPASNQDTWLFESITEWLTLKKLPQSKQQTKDLTLPILDKNEAYLIMNESAIPQVGESTPATVLANPKDFCPSAHVSSCEGFDFNAYKYGVGFMDLVDTILQRESNGKTNLVRVLQKVYIEKKDKSLSTQEFIDVLNKSVPYSWQSLFDRLIFGVKL